MQKLNITLIGFILSITAVCQDLTKKNTIIYIDTLEDNTYIIRQLKLDSVLIFKGKYKSLEPVIKHGKFYFFYSDSKVKYTANYYENIPTGKWMFFDTEGNVIKTLDYDKVWNYMNRAQSNEIKFDCYSQFDDELTIEDLPETEIYFQTEEMPKFQNKRVDSFRDYIFQNINSDIFINDTKSNNIVFQFLVNKCGKIDKIEIISGENIGLNTELFRTIIDAPEWIPGRQRKQNVDVLIKMEIVL